MQSDTDDFPIFYPPGSCQQAKFERNDLQRANEIVFCSVLSMEEVKVSFDGEYKIRILDEEKAQRSVELERECSNFTGKIEDFSGKVSALLDVLDTHAGRIDVQKLRAIGLRMSCENEAENRIRQQRTMQAILSEKRNELDRYNGQYVSLQRIEGEQKLQLQKMTNSGSE